MSAAKQLTTLTVASTVSRIRQAANYHLEPSKQPGYHGLPVGKFFLRACRSLEFATHIVR